MSEARKQYSKGLAGVIAGETAIATVGKKGHGLMYRGYNLPDLTANCIFEQIAFLLLRGSLPNSTQLENYCKSLRTGYQLPGAIRRALELTPKNAHPMDVLKVSTALMGAIYPESDNPTVEETLAIADRLLAAFPSVIAYHYRFHNFGQIIETKANGNDTIAAHFLRLLHQTTPDKTMTDCVNASLICYAEHGFAASTFAARVTTSTLSDAYSSICSAIGTLRGPLHGGANEKAFYLISSYDSSEEAHSDLLRKLERKEKIMGFGHRVYRTNDPRSAIMHSFAAQLSKQTFGKPKMMDIADTIQTLMWDQKKLFPNVDWPVAMCYHQCGIPTNLFTPIFVCARTAGWMAHVLEQRSNNRLIRPAALYVGPQLKEFPRMRSRL